MQAGVHLGEGTGTREGKEEGDARTGQPGTESRDENSLVFPQHLPHTEVPGQDLSLLLKLKRELLPFKVHTHPPPYQKHWRF